MASNSCPVCHPVGETPPKGQHRSTPDGRLPGTGRKHQQVSGDSPLHPLRNPILQRSPDPSALNPKRPPFQPYPRRAPGPTCRWEPKRHVFAGRIDPSLLRLQRLTRSAGCTAPRRSGGRSGAVWTLRSLILEHPDKCCAEKGRWWKKEAMDCRFSSRRSAVTTKLIG